MKTETGNKKTENKIQRCVCIKKLVVTVLAVCICAVLVSCGKADISAYKDRQIMITGLTDEDFYITAGGLAEMKCVSATAHGKSAKAGTVNAYGPTIETFLEKYGKTIDEFRSIRCVASDGYTVTFGKVTWDRSELILSVANGSDALEEKQQPLRIVAPDADSGNWIRAVIQMEFEYAK